MQLYAGLLLEMLSEVSILTVSYVVSGCSHIGLSLPHVWYDINSTSAQLELGIRSTIDVRIPCKQPRSTLRG